ncbi:hypothetical protein tb265_01300 [Gemmatimonadetes bacterium T265]|nr:hypothetical protein tb265_01300 [Gemmatimonadetes bacterium T265]
MVALWHLAYEELVRRATHELNNALNGVAMNLEVARLRAVPGGDAARVAPFAAAAVESHEEVVAMVRALVALGRAPAGDTCDVRETAEQVVALLAPGVRARGGSLALGGDAARARTGAPAAAVRAAVAVVIMTATAGPAAHRRCVVTGGAEPTLAVEPDDGMVVGGDVIEAWARAGIRIGTGVVARALIFPSA